MKKLLLSLLLVSFLTSAWGEPYELGDSKAIFNVPKGWKADGRAEKINDLNSFQARIMPTDGNSTICAISAIYGENGEKKDKQRTEAEVRAAAEAFQAAHKEQVVEKKVVLKEFKLKEGFGFYTTSTDANLVGKPPVKGDWKTSTSGIIDLSDNVRVVVTIFSDNPSDAHFKQALEIIQSATLKKK